MVEAGASLDDFWALSPKDLYWIARTLEQREERADRRVALLCAVFANGLLSKPNKKPFTPEDFLPAKPKRRPSPDELANKARAITLLLGGRVSG